MPGFDFDKMAAAHHRHHAAPGTAQDPDFSVQSPKAFWPWFREFMFRYMSWRPVIFLNSVVAVEWLVFGASMTNLVIFYGAPAMLSAVQLFYFGTYRPHRHEGGEAFADDHRARSSGYPLWTSLLTCYHFGYHHEHHLFPEEPWWRLPARRLRRGEQGQQ